MFVDREIIRLFLQIETSKLYPLFFKARSAVSSPKKLCWCQNAQLPLMIDIAVLDHFAHMESV